MLYPSLDYNCLGNLESDHSVFGVMGPNVLDLGLYIIRVSQNITLVFFILVLMRAKIRFLFGNVFELMVSRILLPKIKINVVQ